MDLNISPVLDIFWLLRSCCTRRFTQQRFTPCFPRREINAFLRFTRDCHILSLLFWSRCPNTNRFVIRISDLARLDTSIHYCFDIFPAAFASFVQRERLLDAFDRQNIQNIITGRHYIRNISLATTMTLFTSYLTTLLGSNPLLSLLVSIICFYLGVSCCYIIGTTWSIVYKNKTANGLAEGDDSFIALDQLFEKGLLTRQEYERMCQEIDSKREPPESQQSEMSLHEKIQAVEQLHEHDLLTEEEYREKRQELFDEI